MRIRMFTLILLAMGWGAANARAGAPTIYYLSLGDSLAQGVQYTASGDVSTNYGYADDLSKLYPGLSLVKLGCSGETTTTMIEGGDGCNYAQPNQLAAAVNFLKTNQVRLVTLDIGANDIDHCISYTGIDQDCITAGLSSVGGNLPYILQQLREAAGPNTQIVAMNYYDPFLAAWALGSSYHAVADASLAAATIFNVLETSIYSAFHVPVADVATAYHIYDYLPVPVVSLPLNVFLELTYTYMDEVDIHPNNAGYAVIAKAFAGKITLP